MYSHEKSAAQIKVKSDAVPTTYTEDGLHFSDGSELKADVIVFSTGFSGDLRSEIRELFGEDVASKVQDFWGLDEEGELNGAFKPCGRKYTGESTSAA